MDTIWVGLGLSFLGCFIGIGMILLGQSVVRAAETLQGVRVTHVIDGLNAMADAWRYDARVRAGIVRAAEKKQIVETPEWTEFEERHGHLEPSELQHMLWAYRVLRGEERVTEEVRADAIKAYSAWQRAGIDLPDVDARSALPKESES